MPKAKKKASVGRESADTKNGLSHKYTLFVNEYVKDLNAVQAAIRIGYSAKNAEANAWRLMANEGVLTAIQDVITKRLKRLKIDQERVLREYEHIAFARMSTYVKVERGRIVLTESDALPENADAAIQGYTETTNEFGGSLSIKLHDKLGALNALSKYLKLFKEEDDDGSAKLSDLERLRDALENGVRTTLQSIGGTGGSK